MSIKIGELELATSKPDDLDAKLIAAKGCNAAEARLWLAGTPIPSLVEAALRPFLAPDAPSPAEVSLAIAKVGVLGVAAEVLALYVDAPTVEEHAA